MKHSLRPLAILTLAALAAAGPIPAGAYSAKGSFERTLKVSGPVELEVTTGAGSITVRPGEADSLRVIGTIQARSGWLGSVKNAEEKVRSLEANPPIEQTDNVIRIGHIEDWWLRRNVSISYDLVVPADTRLNSDTGSGDQSIEGLRGPVKADAGSGSIKISNIGGEVRADTGSGDIELDSITGSVYADTGSGEIWARGIGGGFEADTGSGGVKLEQVAPGDVKVNTGSGSVELRGVRGSLDVDTGSGEISVAGEPAGHWKLAAGSGSITVRLPAQATFDLYAHTSSGRISTEHPISVQGSIGRRELRGKVRGGGFLLDLHTGSGNIYIE